MAIYSPRKVRADGFLYNERSDDLDCLQDNWISNGEAKYRCQEPDMPGGRRWCKLAVGKFCEENPDASVVGAWHLLSPFGDIGEHIEGDEIAALATACGQMMGCLASLQPEALMMTAMIRQQVRAIRGASAEQEFG